MQIKQFYDPGETTQIEFSEEISQLKMDFQAMIEYEQLLTEGPQEFDKATKDDLCALGYIQ